MKEIKTVFFCLVQVASFPFKGNTSFIIVMPMPGRRNVSSVLPKLNISDLYRRLPQEKIMQVILPKVKLQYRQELQEALTSMGENVHEDRREQTTRWERCWCHVQIAEVQHTGHVV